jgi:hypothetical protein
LDYCRKLKSMVDSLGNLGEPVLDRTLVLSVLCVLSEKFAYMGAILKRQTSFPSFAELKNDLMVEEISMAKPAAPSQALVATTQCPPAVGSASSGPVLMQQPKKKNKNKKNSGPAWLASSRSIATAPGACCGVLAWSALSAAGIPQRAYWACLHWAGRSRWLVAGAPGFLPGSALPGVPGPAGFGEPPLGLLGPPLWLPLKPAPPSSGLLQAPPGAVWNQHDLTNNFNTMTLVPPPNTEWYMDSSASSHMASNSSILSCVFSPNHSTPHSIIVGNESLLPVTSTGHTYFPFVDRSLSLYDVLVSPNIINNLISVRRFTTDNLVSVEFDPYDLSVKDLQIRNVIVRCNSFGQLYSLIPSADASLPR